MVPASPGSEPWAAPICRFTEPEIVEHMHQERIMTWEKKAATLPADLEAALAKVRKAAPPPPSDDPIYKYLERVYRLRQKVEKSPELQEAIKAERAAHHPKLSTKYIRLIIELTAGDHVTNKMKHKYTVTLQYAFTKGVKAEDLIEFIKKQGGLNKCVELWSKNYGRSAAAKKRKKNSAT
jgi:hypothetical protein